MSTFSRPQTKAASKPSFTPAPSGLLQRKCACGGSPGLDGECEECRGKRLQRRAASGTEVSTTPPIVHEVLRSPGQPLDPPTRAFFEPRFGHDFSKVRVHADAKAAESAQAVNALAYTVGRDLVFGAEYHPDTSAGKNLLAHELTHAVQQRLGANAATAPNLSVLSDGGAEKEAETAAHLVTRGEPYRALISQTPQIARAPDDELGDDLLDPFEEDPAEEERLERVRDEILDVLRRSGASAFLSRLRALNTLGRWHLENDAAFMSEMRRWFQGKAFWFVRLTLRFGRSWPIYVRHLAMAVSPPRIQGIKDLLRTFVELRTESEVPGVREMLDYELRGNAQHDEVLRLATEAESARETRNETFSEVHYEQPQGGGPYALETLTGRTHFDLARTASELRVIVRIRFVRANAPADTFYLSDEKHRQWRSGIEAAWNNRFIATNGRTRLNIIFVPTFIDHNPHFEVTIIESPSFVRSNETNWWLGDDGNLAAHEFGHMVGNPDEYRLPGSFAELTIGLAALGRSPTVEEEFRSTIEGITGEERPSRVGGHTLPGIMGSQEGPAQTRHVWPILVWYNSNMRPADEAPYNLRSR